MTSLRLHAYILEVAKYCFDNFKDDYYEAINIAESVSLTDDIKYDAITIHMILEGEL